MIDTSAAFPELDDDQLAVLDGLGTRRAVRAGEYLYREGDAHYDFYVVVSGAVEIVLHADGEERVVARHTPRRFLGELNLLTGLRVLLTARVVEDGAVLAVPVTTLRQLIASHPTLGDTIVTAFMARRTLLLTRAAAAIRLVGSRFSPAAMSIREFLARLAVPHEWLDPERDPAAERVLEEAGVSMSELPAVIVSGSVLRRPTAGELSEYLGLTVDDLPDQVFDLVVVGSGPAGLAASVYGASEGLNMLGIDMLAPGGQAGSSSRIENYLGFPTGIPGAELAQRALIQAERFGAQLTTPCTAVSLREVAGHLVVGLSNGTDVAGRAVVVATGARYGRLDVDGLDRFEYRGVFYAATQMEASACAASPVVVVGGGNSAGQAALFLVERGSPVTLVVRSPDLGARMSRYLVERIQAEPRIDVRTATVVTGLDGDETLRSVRIASDGHESDLFCAALFSFIGAQPASAWLCGCAALDERGFLLTDRSLGAAQLGERWSVLGRGPLPFETSRPGLFAVGDVRSGSMKRVAAAVGEGSAAVRSVHEFLAFAH
jgi:thioredoxin reductase (NADPH)